ncbi:MAG: tetratricopeptide repeat protein [Candidatus Rokuibacteriota bacterium]
MPRHAVASRRVTVSLLAAAFALLPAATSAQIPPPLAREQALEALRAPDAATRVHAIASLAVVGTMADVPGLVRALRDDERVVRGLAERALWQVWSRSGDAEVDALFALGLQQMGQGDAGPAIATFGRVIERKPDFAEGWNKRATLYYLVGEYEKSLRDCDEVMKRNPAHFGALSGYGQIYMRLNQPEKALAYFERALAVNPNMEQVEEVIQELRALVREKRKGTI